MVAQKVRLVLSAQTNTGLFVIFFFIKFIVFCLSKQANKLLRFFKKVKVVITTITDHLIIIIFCLFFYTNLTLISNFFKCAFW